MLVTSFSSPHRAFAGKVEFEGEIQKFVDSNCSTYITPAYIARILSAAGYKGKIVIRNAQRKGLLEEKIQSGSIDLAWLTLSKSSRSSYIFTELVKASEIYWVATGSLRSNIKLPSSGWSGQDTSQKELFDYLVNSSKGPGMTVKQMMDAMLQARRSVRVQTELSNISVVRNKKLRKGSVEDILHRLDANGDGKVSMQEAQRVWRFINIQLSDADIKALVDPSTLRKLTNGLRKLGLSEEKIRLLFGVSRVAEELKTVVGTEGDTDSQRSMEVIDDLVHNAVLEFNGKSASDTDLREFAGQLRSSKKLSAALKEALLREMKSHRDVGAIFFIALYLNGHRSS